MFSTVAGCSSGIVPCNDDKDCFHQEVCRDDICQPQADEDRAESACKQRPKYGQVCKLGVGECLRLGKYVCVDGQLVCSARAGKPQPEECDGKDNNCDGIVDDGLGAGQECKVGIGECQRIGTFECGNQELICNVKPGAKSFEICDHKDNDCDGHIDESFQLGQPCTNGAGACRKEGILVCNLKTGGVMCNAVPGTPSQETCDGKDNDCDGSIDEDFPLQQICTKGVGECARKGKIACHAVTKTPYCNAIPGAPSPERCDGKDNDCDGTIDETFQLGQTCDKGVGECRRRGKVDCHPQTGRAYCNAIPAPSSQETCDGKDNDCDGFVDENFPLGQSCSAQSGGCERQGQYRCHPSTGGLQCHISPGTPCKRVCTDGTRLCSDTVLKVCLGGQWKNYQCNDTLCAASGYGSFLYCGQHTDGQLYCFCNAK